VQQLQALLTLAWSALLLREHVTRVTVLAAVAVVVCAVWAQRARVPAEAAPQE
jgi:drug/metabolite transporter (DMT)-like permease